MHFYLNFAVNFQATALGLTWQLRRWKKLSNTLKGLFRSGAGGSLVKPGPSFLCITELVLLFFLIVKLRVRAE